MKENKYKALLADLWSRIQEDDAGRDDESKSTPYCGNLDDQFVASVEAALKGDECSECSPLACRCGDTPPEFTEKQWGEIYHAVDFKLHHSPAVSGDAGWEQELQEIKDTIAEVYTV